MPVLIYYGTGWRRPGVNFLKVLTQRAGVTLVLTDEYRTSKLCAVDGTELKDVKARTGAERDKHGNLAVPSLVSARHQRWMTLREQRDAGTLHPADADRRRHRQQRRQQRIDQKDRRKEERREQVRMLSMPGANANANVAVAQAEEPGPGQRRWQRQPPAQGRQTRRPRQRQTEAAV